MKKLGEFIAWSGKNKTKCLEEENTSGAQQTLANEISVTKQEWVIMNQNNEKGSSEHFRTLGEKVCSCQGRILQWLSFITLNGLAA